VPDERGGGSDGTDLLLAARSPETRSPEIGAPPYRIASIRGMPVEVHGVMEAAGLSETLGNWGTSTVQPDAPGQEAKPSEKTAFLDYQLDTLCGRIFLNNLMVLRRFGNRRYGGAPLFSSFFFTSFVVLCFSLQTLPCATLNLLLPKGYVPLGMSPAGAACNVRCSQGCIHRERRRMRGCD
jgi:hypothetical protein